MKRKAIALLLIALLGCTSAGPPSEQKFFAFHSNFWLNLHHFLRVAARGMPAPAELTADERAAWDRAVAFYKANYAQRDLLHDEVMSGIRVALRDAREKSSLEGAAISDDLRATLESAAPIYRRHWWPAHDNANRAWIASVEPLLREHGKNIGPWVARSYGEQWPAEPIPVDLTMTAGPNGAYAAFPPHITISSMEFSTRGLASLESVFHEASHQWGRRLSTKIREAEARHGKEVPRGLWHAVLFYNAGEITRRVLAAHGVPGYVELATAGNMYADFCGAGCRDVIARHWEPVIEGKATYETALDQIVAAWPV